MKRPTYSTIDEYIADFPPEVQVVLQKIRRAIQRAAPKAEEVISYQIPAFKLNGKVLIYFAAFKKHVSVYPAPRTAPEFKDELAQYKGGKGTIQFPVGHRIQFDLIRRMVKFKINNNLDKSQIKTQ